MYNVSPEYIAAVRALSRTDRLTGVLELTHGTSIELKDNRVYEKTLELMHDVVTGEEIEFGAAMLKQLSFSLRTHQDRYVFYDAKITPYYGVKLADGTWYDIPLGVFRVAEAERSTSFVQLYAYDDLIRFDKDYDGVAITGSDFEVLAEICEKCGVSLGITEAEIAEFPNGGGAVYIDSQTGCRTYRDCLKVIAQKLAAFVTTDRAGNLILRRFSKTPDATLARSNRFKTTLADFVCRYAGVTVQAGENKVSSYDTTVSSGLELIIPDAPAWEFGTEETLQAQTDALMAELAQMPYTPSKLTISNDPAIECGDMLELETESGTVNTIVTGFTWRYRARMDIDSTGANPYLKAIQPQKSQIIRELEKQTVSNKLIFYSFTNSTALTVEGTEVQPLANVTFVTVEDTTAMFLAQLQLTVQAEDSVTESEEEQTVTVKDQTGATATIYDANGNPLTLTVRGSNTTVRAGEADVEIFYYLDGSLVDYTLTERLTTGPHILSLFYPFADLGGDKNFTWDVRIRVTGGSATIEKGALKATITGQGLAATIAWDGTLTFEEVVAEPFALRQGGLSVVKAVESITTETQAPTSNAITETVAPFRLRSSLSLVGFTDRFSTGEIRQKFTVGNADWQYHDRYISDETGDIMARIRWKYDGEEQAIDSGRMTAVKAITNDLGSVQEVTVSG